jgi:Major tropism determinant N-terminal domain
MAIQIQFRRGTAAEWTAANPILALAEMGIETDTDLFKIGDGVKRWTELSYGGIQGYTGSAGYAGSIGNIAVANVLYVSKSGNDAYDGKSFNTSKLTIKAAVAIASTGTTIFVKSGDYTEINPIVIPANVSIIGDNLRAVTIRPHTPDQDIFYVHNGVYIAGVTFKDHVSPAACVAFPPDGSAGFIHTSPYVQNCSSITSTGTGMRVDGNYAEGTKSMVVDAFTQYNQGGIGIHMLNGGYTQLVSVFTICCDKAILCESGGNCSITNSNSSFGNYALYSDGVGPTLYTGNMASTSTTGPTAVFTLTNLTTQPVVGQAITFDGGQNYYTVASSTPFSVGNTTINNPTLSGIDVNLLNARSTILSNLSNIQVKTIIYLTETYPDFSYDQYKCNRDIGTIVNCVLYDMVLNSNYQSITAGIAYTRGASSNVIGAQNTQTVAAINFVQNQVLGYVSTGSTAYNRIQSNFTTLLDIFSNGTGSIPAYSFVPSPTSSSNVQAAVDNLQANISFFQAEVTKYIQNTFTGFSYNTSTCYRDVGYIIDAVTYDMALGSNFKSIKAGMAYYRGNTSSYAVIETELMATNAAFEYLEGLMINLISTDLPSCVAIKKSFRTILNILNNGLSAVPAISLPKPTIIDPGYANAVTLLELNRPFITYETLSYIANNYPSLSFSTSTCARDIGYIIDAVKYDLTYGGTSESIHAGNAYWSYNVRQISSSEVTATEDAYSFMSGVMQDVVQNITQTPNQTAASQVYGAAGSPAAASTIGFLIGDITQLINDNAASVSLSYPDLSWTPATTQASVSTIQSNTATLQSSVVSYINQNFVTFSYNTATCQRDIGYIIEAISYDTMYGGNSQTSVAADAYYNGAVSVINTETVQTIAAYNYLSQIAQKVVQNIPVTVLQSTVPQVLTVTTATSAEANTITSLFSIITNILENGYSSTITLNETLVSAIPSDSYASFHQFSLITTSGHTFEYVGAGINIDTALPTQGGVGISDNYAVSVNGGKVFFTGTDQQGDFRVGSGFTIQQATGLINGRTFTKSLFAVMTPYILAISS